MNAIQTHSATRLAAARSPQAAGTTTVCRRDGYGALDTSAVLTAGQHQELRELLDAAVSAGHLPKPFITSGKRELESLNHDVYDVQLNRLRTVKAVIVQLRWFSTDKRKGYTQLRKEYVLVARDRKRLVATALESATCVKRAKTATVLGQLIAHYTGGPTLRCKAPVVKTNHGYKVLALDSVGTLRSVFDDSEYRPNTWRSEAARQNHGGGFYYYDTAEEALEGMERSLTFNRQWTDGKELVLCLVEVAGRAIDYDAGKKAASRLRVLHVEKRLSGDQGHGAEG